MMGGVTRLGGLPGLPGRVTLSAGWKRWKKQTSNRPESYPCGSGNNWYLPLKSTNLNTKKLKNAKNKNSFIDVLQRLKSDH